MNTQNTIKKDTPDSFKRATMMGLLVAIGIVFGDIGTSPLYVMKAITRVNATYDQSYILGAISCIFWTLTIQTTIKYVLIALKADNKGEGGILALYSLVKSKKRKWLYLIGAIGASTLVADGVITPAVTVTSAIEGLRMISPEIPVVPIVIVIISFIFIIQTMGTGSIGKWFGPVMVVWFASLGVLGILSIPSAPVVLKSFNPYYAFKLLIDYPGWFMILGAVFLCTTGAEALYSDLGHCGKLNISISWIFVKIMLVINYLGQGAWLLSEDNSITQSMNPFYGIVPHGFLIIEIILATLAAVIASQALISGSFTIFSEAINLQFWPRMRIKYPSDTKGQLFIPTINIALFIGCIVTVLLFRSSDNMEAAYGLAITVTMLMTTFLLSVYMLHKKVPKWIVCIFLVSFSILEGAFLIANLFKFMHGGWYTLMLAGIILMLIYVWHNGSGIKNSYREFHNIDKYFGVLSDMSADKEIPKFSSNLVYFNNSDSDDKIESKMIYSIINKQPKRADHYWFIRMIPDDAPETLKYSVKVLNNGLIFCVTIHLGYRVQPKITVYLRQIVEDLVNEGVLDLKSRYPSLRKHDITGEFRFVIIHRVFSKASSYKKFESIILHFHDIIAKYFISDSNALGLDLCNVVEEKAPLILTSGTPRRIKRIQDIS